MERTAVHNGNGRTAPVKVFCGLILCFAVLGASGTWKVAACAAGFWALATALLRRAGPVPWWYHMLAAAPGGVIGALLTTSLQTPASVLDFATLQSAVSTGMMVGFVTGVGLSLMIRAGHPNLHPCNDGHLQNVRLLNEGEGVYRGDEERSAQSCHGARDLLRGTRILHAGHSRGHRLCNIIRSEGRDRSGFADRLVRHGGS